MEDKSKFVPPRNITLDKLEYSYKDFLINDYYSYRCKYRNACKITIKIVKKELINIIDNKVNERIKYSKTCTEKNHQCDKYNKETNEIEINKKKVKPNFLKSIIISKIEKPFLFHYNNIRNNNIFMTLNQIKWALQKLREKCIF